VCSATECELVHTGSKLRAGAHLNEDQRRIEMNRAFRQARTRLGLTGSTPVIELVAVRILELARAGQFDPDKVTETVVATFDM
jgi:hypothetical protein